MANARVGIGTTAPSETLQINHAAADGDGGILIVNEATTIGDDAFLGGIGFDGADGNIPSSVGEAGAAIVARSAEAHSTADKGADLLFLTAPIDQDDDTTTPERLRITSEGKVGIGETAPTAQLHVFTGDSGFSGAIDTDYDELCIEGSGNTGVTILCPAANTGAIVFGDNADKDMGRIKYNHADNSMSFFVNNSADPNMTIADGGEIGIGIAAPTVPLHVYGAGSQQILLESSNNHAILAIEAGSASYDCQLQFNANGDASAATIWYDHNATAASQSLNFVVGDGGFDAMTILGDGKLGIGETAPATKVEIKGESGGHCILTMNTAAGDLDAGITLQENNTNKWTLYNDADGHSGGDNTLALYDYSDSSVSMHVVPGGQAWVAGSDERIKKDIENIDSVLDGINSLRPITYKKKYGKLDITHAGLIAQEVKPHFPLLVSGEEDSFIEIPAKDAVLDDDGKTIEEATPIQSDGGLGLAYAEFVPYLIKAIQELTAKVEALEWVSDFKQYSSNPLVEDLLAGNYKEAIETILDYNNK